MVNEQLINYIKTQSQQGFTNDQIKSALLSSGWNQADIEAGLQAVAQPVNPPAAMTSAMAPGESVFTTNAAVPKKTKSSLMTVSIIAIILLVLVGGIVALFYTNLVPVPSQIANLIGNQASIPETTPVPTVEPTPTPSLTPTPTPTPVMTEVALVRPSIFNDNLTTCEISKTTYTSTDTADIFEREIKGLTNGKCVYIEQQSAINNLKCDLPATYLPAVSGYYKNLSIGTTAMYVIDGKSVSDPIKEATATGICVVEKITDTTTSNLTPSTEPQIPLNIGTTGVSTTVPLP